MRITCWGSRGSIPVSGPEYLRYGGDTTCVEIRTADDETIIVDAGTGIRRLGQRLLALKRYAYHFIFTHAHWDHVMGFPFFQPLYTAQAELWMHRCPFQNKFVETLLAKVMQPPNFPVRYADLKARIVYHDACPAAFDIGTVTITPVSLSHPNGGVGYKFVEGGKAFVFLTDNELGHPHPGSLTREAYAAFCNGADLLWHDAEFTPREYAHMRQWGHSSYTDALALACEAGAGALGLFHLNPDRTDAQMDTIVEACRQHLVAAGRQMDCYAVGQDRTVCL